MTGQDATSDRDGHGMGDERSGDASGRRHARSAKAVRGRARGDGSVPGREESYGHESPSGDSPLEALLAAAIRGEKCEDEAERRAVGAFRAARDAGEHRARTRRRDDWRPRTRWGRARSLRVTLSVLLASLTLGGVAYAAIGSAGGGDDRGAARETDVRPSVSAGAPAGSPSGARSSAPAASGRPPTAKDTLAHCRVYEKLGDHGKALDSTAFRRLVAAAGGEANVSAYCAALTDAADAKSADGAKGTANANANANGGGNAEDAGGAKPGKQKDKASGGQNADGNASGKQ
ncbi:MULTISPECIES: hypothetical protein [unclassified Streptomyces]|uniref:hypothetical protein n=1 Tax=unclassified Streptomyces TaxID=2593676 RepID=UPI002476C96D|nr:MULTISPECIES: hypothetical protein [unclassified Streptomyces]MDH6452423.1 hypothetical protein [Streptomyces sp. SAI-119]MDH6497021.1 hypothetical protein [Streptomyces sp. SAI-149]